MIFAPSARSVFLFALATLTVASVAVARDASDVFLQAYQQFKAAERLEEAQDQVRALALYRKVEGSLQELRETDASWQPVVVNYRLKRTREALVRLESSMAPAQLQQVAKEEDFVEDFAGPLPSSPEATPARPTLAAGPVVTTARRTPARTPRSRFASTQPGQTPRRTYSPPSTAVASGGITTLGQAIRKIAELTRVIETEKGQRNTLIKQLDVARRSAIEAQRTLDLRTVDVVELKSQLAQSNDEILNLKSEVPDPAQLAADEELQREEFSRLMKEASAEAEVLREENERLLAKLNSAAEYITKSDEIRLQLDTQRIDLAAERSGLREQVSQEQERNAKLGSRLSKAELAVAEGQEIMANLRRENESKQVELAQALRSNTALEEQLRDAQTTPTAQQDTTVVEAMAQRIEDLEAELIAKAAEARRVADLEQRVAELQQEAAQAKQLLAQREADLLVANSRAEQAESEVLPPMVRSDSTLAAENNLLRNIIIRQIKQQNQREVARESIRSKLEELQIESRGLEAQLAFLAAPVIELTQDEKSLFVETVSLLPGEGSADLELDMTISKPAQSTGSETLTAANRQLVDQAQEHFNQRDFAQAAQIYQDLAKSLPGNYFVLSNLGAVQLESGALPEAAKTFRQALDLSPNDSFARTHLGVALTRQNQFQEAMGILENAVEVNPQDSIARNYLGVCYAQTNNRTAAERQLQRAIELNSNYANAHFNLAVLYATVQPVAMDLAKQHYNLAKQLGASPDSSLEELIQ